MRRDTDKSGCLGWSSKKSRKIGKKTNSKQQRTINLSCLDVQVGGHLGSFVEQAVLKLPHAPP